jgi:hypothetical protein
MSKQIKVSIAGHLALDRGRDGMDSPEAPQSGTGTVDPHKLRPTNEYNSNSIKVVELTATVRRSRSRTQGSTASALAAAWSRRTATARTAASPHALTSPGASLLPCVAR